MPANNICAPYALGGTRARWLQLTVHTANLETDGSARPPTMCMCFVSAVIVARAVIRNERTHYTRRTLSTVLFSEEQINSRQQYYRAAALATKCGRCRCQQQQRQRVYEQIGWPQCVFPSCWGCALPLLPSPIFRCISKCVMTVITTSNSE